MTMSKVFPILQEQAVRLPHSLEPDGYRFWIRSTVQSSPETMRQHQSAFMAISNGVADVCVVDVPTAESTALTNKDLKIINLDEKDTFKDDDEMVNVCIATRKR